MRHLATPVWREVDDEIQATATRRTRDTGGAASAKPEPAADRSCAGPQPRDAEPRTQAQLAGQHLRVEHRVADSQERRVAARPARKLDIDGRL